MLRKQYISVALFTVIFLVSACTDLNEEVFSSIPEKDFYKTESEFLAAMVPVYSSMRALTEHASWWDLEETTDICVTPVKNHGLWYDGGIYIRLHQHSWMEQDVHLNNIWNVLYSGVSSANRVLYQFENSTIEMEGRNSYISELKVARAFYYYLLLETFGNIPIIDRFDVPDGYLPKTESRSKVFEFVETELKNNIDNLSEDVLRTYGRFNKWNAKMLLARLYLNAEAWIGTPMYSECEKLCDEIIEAKKYRLDALLPRTAEQAGATYYVMSLILFVLGRFICTWLMKYTRPVNILSGLGILAVICSLLTIYGEGFVGVYALMGISGCMSAMFPTIYGLGMRGLGDDTKIAGSGMVMAIAGAALLTQVQGILSDQAGSIKFAYWVPAVAFIIITYYSFTIARSKKLGNGK
jgi:hypothetical protein